jgi:hypothetical protein
VLPIYGIFLPIALPYKLPIPPSWKNCSHLRIFARLLPSKSSTSSLGTQPFEPNFIRTGSIYRIELNDIECKLKNLLAQKLLQENVANFDMLPEEALHHNSIECQLTQTVAVKTSKNLRPSPMHITSGKNILEKTLKKRHILFIYLFLCLNVLLCSSFIIHYILYSPRLLLYLFFLFFTLLAIFIIFMLCVQYFLFHYIFTI